MNRTQSRAAVPVPAKALREIRSVHDAASGRGLNAFAFVLYASRLGKMEAVTWVSENPLSYVRGKQKGFVEEP